MISCGAWRCSWQLARTDWRLCALPADGTEWGSKEQNQALCVPGHPQWLERSWFVTRSVYVLKQSQGTAAGQWPLYGLTNLSFDSGEEEHFDYITYENLNLRKLLCDWLSQVACSAWFLVDFGKFNALNGSQWLPSRHVTDTYCL